MKLKQIMARITAVTISSEALRVLVAILLKRKTVSGEITVSNKSLSESTGLPPSNITRAVTTLKTRNIISLTKNGIYVISVNDPAEWIYDRQSCN